MRTGRDSQGSTANPVPNDRVLGVELYFSPVAVARTPIVSDVVNPEIDHDLDVPVESTAQTSPSDLGGDDKRLSDATIGTLARYCDALEQEPPVAFTGDRADPVCTEYLTENWCLFVTHISFPERIEYIHADGLRDQGQRLGLPTSLVVG